MKEPNLLLLEVAKSPLLLWSGGKDSSVLLHAAKDHLEKTLVLFIDCGGLYPDVLEWVTEKGKSLPHFHIIRPAGDIMEYLQTDGVPMDIDVADMGRYARELGAQPPSVKIQPWTNCIASRVWEPLTRFIREQYQTDLLVTGEREKDRPYGDWSSPSVPSLRPVFDWSDEEVWAYIDTHGIELPPTFQGRQKDRRDCWLCLGGHDFTPGRIRELKEKWPEQYELLFETVGAKHLFPPLISSVKDKLSRLEEVADIVRS